MHRAVILNENELQTIVLINEKAVGGRYRLHLFFSFFQLEIKG